MLSAPLLARFSTEPRHEFKLQNIKYVALDIRKKLKFAMNFYFVLISVIFV
jgi:hypothetical protein